MSDAIRSVPTLPAQAPATPGPAAAAKVKGRILMVDDERPILNAYGRLLRAAGYEIEQLEDARRAPELIASRTFDVVLSDIGMPGMNGLELLREVRRRDPDLPVVLMTAGGDLRSALEAIQHGAMRYLLKPVAIDELQQTIDEAVRLRKIAMVKRQAYDLYGSAATQASEKEDLETRFESALAQLHMAYQPIVQWSNQSIHAYEALVRTGEATLRRPDHLFAAAEQLGRVPELGRHIRRHIAATIDKAPAGVRIFVNLHPSDLADDDLYSDDSPLNPYAARVTLEITERAALEEIDDVRGKVAALRKRGFQIAIDDLGAGYAGLSSFAQLQPEVVKIDMSLVRDIEKEPTKQKLVRSLVALCRDLGNLVIAEGVETAAERDTLIELGADMLQGYLFAKPAPPFPLVQFQARAA